MKFPILSLALYICLNPLGGSCQSQVCSGDSLELVKFYNSLGGQNWKTTWDLTKPIGTWYGIMLSDDGCVKCLDMDGGPNIGEYDINIGSGNALSGVIPDINLPYLTSLIISFNQISGEIPDFSGLPNLNVLYCSYNRLTGPIPDFSNLQNLEHLNCEANSLTGGIPDFTLLPNLKTLFCANNPLGGSIPDFRNLPKLETLLCWNNQLTGEIPDFTNCPSLKELQVTINKIEGAIPDFSNLPNLEVITTEENLISGEIPDLSDNCPRIRLYWAEENYLTFEDIVNNITPNSEICKTNGGFFRYENQALIYHDTTLSASAGDRLVIDLGVDEGLESNIYRWYKNGEYFTVIHGNNNLEFASLSPSDRGIYNVEITNPNAPELTLHSPPIKINVNNTCPDCPVELAVNTKKLWPGELIRIAYNIKDPSQSYRLFFGDGESLLLDQPTQTVPYSYSKPGQYTVEIRDEQDIRQAFVKLVVLSCGWTGFAVRNNEQREPNESLCNLIDDGQLYLRPELVDADLYWSNFQINKPMGRVAEGTQLSARIRISPATGGISCFDPSLYMYGENGDAFIRFMQPGCSFYSMVVAGETIKRGSRDDLRAMVGNFSDWVVISFTLDQDKISVYFDNRLVYWANYEGDIGEVWGFGLSFKGSGSVDWISWKDIGTDEILYEDGFTSCESNVPLSVDFDIEQRNDLLYVIRHSEEEVITKVYQNGVFLLYSDQDTVITKFSETESLKLVSSNGCESDTLFWVKRDIVPDTICLYTDSLIIEHDELFELPIYASGDNTLTGIQLSFAVTDPRLKVTSVHSPLLGWGPDNYTISDDKIQVVWIGLNGNYTLGGEDPLFTLEALWDSQVDTCIKPVIVLDSSILGNRILELYNEDVRDVEICMGTSTICFDLKWDVNGQILHRTRKPFPDVHVSGGGMQDITDHQGRYELRGLKQDSVHISARYDSDPWEGVDIMDMVALYRHQLRLEELQESFAWLAGDVNGDGFLSLADLAYIQLMLLRKIDRWPLGKSWVFVADNNFSGQELLEITPEIVAFKSIPNPVGIGVKIGDVIRETDRFARAGRELTLLDYEIKPGIDRMEYSIDLSPVKSGLGFQMDVEYDAEYLKWNPSTFDLTFMNEVEPGVIRIAWINKQDVPDEIVLDFKKKKLTGNISEIQIHQGLIAPKLVLENGLVNHIGLTRRWPSGQEIAVQVFPNPTSDYLNIAVDNFDGQNMECVIYNHLGQIVYREKVGIETDYQIKRIHISEMMPEGVYHYRITSGSFQQSGSFILQ